MGETVVRRERVLTKNRLRKKYGAGARVLKRLQGDIRVQTGEVSRKEPGANKSAKGEGGGLTRGRQRERPFIETWTVLRHLQTIFTKQKTHERGTGPRRSHPPQADTTL